MYLKTCLFADHNQVRRQFRIWLGGEARRVEVTVKESVSALRQVGVCSAGIRQHIVDVRSI